MHHDDVVATTIVHQRDLRTIQHPSVHRNSLSTGARAELQFTAEGGMLNIQMDRPQGTPSVPARGQLCLVVFTVKASGQSPLVLNEQQTQFRNSSGQPIPIKVHSSQVEIR